VASSRQSVNQASCPVKTKCSLQGTAPGVGWSFNSIDESSSRSSKRTTTGVQENTCQLSRR
jgi:hypothetical protein